MFGKRPDNPVIYVPFPETQKKPEPKFGGKFKVTTYHNGTSKVFKQTYKVLSGYGGYHEWEQVGDVFDDEQRTVEACEEHYREWLGPQIKKEIL